MSSKHGEVMVVDINDMEIPTFEDVLLDIYIKLKKSFLYLYNWKNGE